MDVTARRRRVARLGLGAALWMLAAGCASQPTDAGSPPTTVAEASPPVDGETSEPATTAATDPAEGCTVAAAVASWPLRQRLAQLVMVGVSPTDPAEAQIAAEAGLGGIYVRRRGDATGVYTSGVLAELRSPEGVPLSVAVDDEGGRVQSIDALAGSLPSARDQAELSPDEVAELARQRGDRLRSYGVTVDFAPVVDVSSQPDGDVIGDRSYADDPVVVTTYAAAFSRGLADAGVTPVLKHFPGHGRATGDTHVTASRTPDIDELRQVDLEPFRALMDDGAWVMVGHLEVPGLTDGEPATVSAAAIDGLVRDELGFDGVVVSDELGGMLAVADRYDLPEATRRFLAAGGDVALWAEGGRSASVLDHLEAAVAAGTLPQSRVDESVARVLQAKGHDPCA